MSEPFIAEIRIFAGNFAPRGWAFCEGQLLPIAQNTALFSLIGTTYGGDGRTTCALPDLQGRAPMHPGRAPGLSAWRLGQKAGAETDTLQPNEMPHHSHSYEATSGPGSATAPASDTINARSIGASAYASAGNEVAMNPAAIGNTGGGQAHQNMQPYLPMYFIIALQGLYPSRS